MRKLFILIFSLLVFTNQSDATSVSVSKSNLVSVKERTPGFVLVQNIFRKIFTGKEQMSERKRKRLARKAA